MSLKNSSCLNSHTELVDTAEDAAVNADLIVTDVWASMGQEEEQKIREKAFADYQVNERLMDLAHPDCLFMHCLPAHRGEEISENMLDHKMLWFGMKQKTAFMQKALVEFLLNENLKKTDSFKNLHKLSTNLWCFLFQLL